MWISSTTYNRPEYTIRSFESLAKTDFPADTHLVIVDDRSDNKDIAKFILEFSLRKIKNLSIHLIVNKTRLGCDPNMLSSCYYCLKNTADPYIVSIDNDAIYNPQWLNKLISVKDRLQGMGHNVGQVSVFNTLQYHPFVMQLDEEVGVKKDVGSLGAIINRKIFENYDFKKPKWKTSWDINCSRAAMEMGMSIFCTYKSYIEHIGIKGTHSDGVRQMGDVAENFVGE